MLLCDETKDKIFRMSVWIELLTLSSDTWLRPPVHFLMRELNSDQAYSL